MNGGAYKLSPLSSFLFLTLNVNLLKYSGTLDVMNNPERSVLNLWRRRKLKGEILKLSITQEDEPLKV